MLKWPNNYCASAWSNKGLHKNKLLIIEEVILCANKAKNVTIVELR